MTSAARTRATDVSGVVLADFGKSASLPTVAVVPIEFMPDDPGEHELTCHMGMLRGRIVVEAG